MLRLVVAWNLITLLCFSNAFSEDKLSDALTYCKSFELPATNAAPLANLEGEPSTLVHNCVNIISGQFCFCQTDLVVHHGTDPLTVERSFAGSKIKNSALGNGWQINHSSYIFFKQPLAKHEGTVFGAVIEDHGGYITFERTNLQINENVTSVPLKMSCFNKAVTNNSQGYLSGQTNLRNQIIDILPYGNCVLKSGSGKTREYQLMHHGAKNIYWLSREWRPTGNSIRYSFAYAHHTNQMDYVSLENSNSLPLGHLKFSKIKPGKHSVQTITSNDGRSVTYKFDRLKDGANVLSKVERSDGPSEEYLYLTIGAKDNTQNFISSKKMPLDRSLAITYYKFGPNKILGQDMNLEDSKDPRKYRVKQLWAPAGTDSTPVPIYHFIYDLNIDYADNNSSQREFKNGACNVFDALKNRSQYVFDENHRLAGINKFHSNGDIYTTELMSWGDNNGQNNTCLLSRCFMESGKTVFERKYVYDSAGNVLEDRLYGNLSGTSRYNYLAECYTKKHVYSTDGLNLLLEETDGTSSTKNIYVPGTNRLMVKYQGTSSKILRRWFYTYNDDATVTQEIADDGCGLEKSNLSGVTERHITNYTQSQLYPIGFPLEIEQKCLDMATGQELLIHKVVNTYNGQAKITKQDHYDSNGAYRYSLHWEYDNMGNVTKEIDAAGREFGKRYDVLGNCSIQWGPRTDCYNELYYDFMNRLIVEKEIHKDGITFTTSHRYDLLGNRTATIDHNNNETNFQYDPFGRIIHIDYPAVMTDAKTLVRPVVKRGYDAMSKMTSEIDASGIETKYEYTIRGQLAATYYPDGTKEMNTYNMNGTLRESRAKNGTVTKYEYDALGRPISTQIEAYDVNLTTTKVYTGFHVIEETDPMGFVTKYSYYPDGKLKSKQKGDALSEYVYDALGRLVKTKEYHGDDDTKVTVMAVEYDILNRVVEERIEDNVGNIVSCINYAFDISGNVEAVTKYNLTGTNTTKIAYDSRGVPTLVTDAEGNKTITKCLYNYKNQQGQIVTYKEVIDPLGNVTISIQDTLGRTVQVERKNAFGKTIQFQLKDYDLAGNLCMITDRVIAPGGDSKDVISLLTYDTSKRLVACYEAVGTPEQKQTKIAYDRFGQKEKLTKNDGTILYHTYDPMGRLKTLKSSDGTVEYVYQYDLNNNPIRVDDVIHNISSKRTYDGNNRLLSESLANGLSLAFENDRIGRPLKLTLPDNTAVAYRYYTSFLGLVFRLNAAGETLYTHTYEGYDRSRNPVKATLAGNAGFLHYNYDILGREKLIHSTHWNEAILKYDSVGNILERKIQDSDGASSSSYTYDDLYQIKSEKGATDHTYLCDSMYNRRTKDGRSHQLNALHQLLDDGISRYQYDGNGNLKERKSDEITSTYTYDALDRLTSFCDGSQKVEYLYDENNRRLSKSFFSIGLDGQWCLSQTIRYLYQGQNEIGAVDDKGKIFELRLLGIGKGAEIGASVAMELHDKLYIPLHDHIGNVSCLLDAETGQSVESYRYSAFGEPLFEDAITPWTYASKRYDAETGFIYFGRRYYDPNTGRWVTPDPIGREGGPNLYAYVLNSPLTHFDQYGLFAMDGQFGSMLNSCFNAVGNFLTNMAKLPGRTLNFIGFHLVPIPYVKDAVEFGGWCLAGKNPKNFVPSWNREHSKLMKHEGYGYGAPGIMHMLYCGILTTANEFRERMADYSKANGGVTTWGAYNDTQGFLLDVFEVGCQKLGIPTRAQQSAEKSTRAVVNQMGGRGTIIAEAHSQGAETVHNLSGGLKGMMDVTAFGPARVLERKEFKNARNFIGRFDFVPLFDPPGLIKGMFQNNVHYLPTTGCPIKDHYYDSEEYTKLRNFAGDQFKQRYGAVL